jgi:hypothetical protein
MEDVVVGRRKIRLKMSLTNLIEFKKEEGKWMEPMEKSKWRICTRQFNSVAWTA